MGSWGLHGGFASATVLGFLPGFLKKPWPALNDGLHGGNASTISKSLGVGVTL
jgi:hypothetical protein